MKFKILRIRFINANNVIRSVLSVLALLLMNAIAVFKDFD